MTHQRLAIDRKHGGADEPGLIDFSVSLNPLGPPPEAIEAYKRAAAQISFYPPSYPRRLEAGLAQWLGIDAECVLAANGSTQLIYLLARALKLRSPCVVVPTFSEIANALVASGSHPIPIETSSNNNFRLDPNDVRAAFRTGADAIFLGRPNSPTGNLVSLEEAAAIAAECHRHDAWCVFDEAFIEFADDPRSAVELLSNFPKLIVLRSLTKIFAIPGLRLGYLVSHAKNVAMLRDVIDPWSVNVAADAVARACLEVSNTFIEDTRDLIAIERRWMEVELGRFRKFRIFPSSANFVMTEVSDEKVSGDFGRYLRRNGILIRDLRELPGCGAGFYRLGIRTHTDNARLVAAASGY